MRLYSLSVLAIIPAIAFAQEDPDLVIRNCLACHSKSGAIMRSFSGKSENEILEIISELKHRNPGSVMNNIAASLTDNEISRYAKSISQQYGSVTK